MPEKRKDVDDCGVSLETIAHASALDLLLARVARLEEENAALRRELALCEREQATP